MMGPDYIRLNKSVSMVFLKRVNRIQTFFFTKDNFAVPNILQDAIKKSQFSIMELLEQLMQKVYKFTAAVENVLPDDFSDENLCCCEDKKLPDFVTEDDVHWGIEMLTAFRQKEIYIRLRIFIVLAEICFQNTKKSFEKLIYTFILM